MRDAGQKDASKNASATEFPSIGGVAAGRGGSVTTLRHDIVNFGFQEPWKIFARFSKAWKFSDFHFQSLEAW
jgi:hypothetical protein